MRKEQSVVLALGVTQGVANSVITACQNLMLAARALGIGSVPTTLHAKVMDRFHALFGIPKDTSFHFAIPIGYPRGAFGGSRRLPTSGTSFVNRWVTASAWTWCPSPDC